MKKILSFLLAAGLLMTASACSPAKTEDTSEYEETLPEETSEAVPPTLEELGLPIKEHLDPSITRPLADHIVGAESDAEPDRPLVIFDSTLEKYALYQDTEITRNETSSYAWNFGKQNQLVLNVPEDLSEYKAYSFWMYADPEDVGATFLVYFSSENQESEGIDYYSFWVNVEQEGWTYYSGLLNGCSVARQPRGWEQIDQINLTSIGWEQDNDMDTVLHLEKIILHTSTDALHSSGFVLDNAVAFSLNGPRAAYEDKVMNISLTDTSSVPFLEDGVYWLPLAVFAAVRDENADYNAADHVLQMTLDGVKYIYTGGSDTVVTDGGEQPLDFTVRIQGDALFAPHTYIMETFGYGEIYTDEMGVIVLSNVPDTYDLKKDLSLLLDIAYATLFTRPTGKEVVEDMYDHLGTDAHPRIMLTEDDFDRLREYSNTDKAFQTMLTALKAKYGVGSTEFTDEPVKWELRDGVRLLYVSREAKDRIIPWCMLWQLTGDDRYAERVWEEVEALCSFPDWHPEHFLDTAEICYPMAIAYDWLYDYWTPEQRSVMEQAVLNMGLLPGLDRYEGRASIWGDNNWTGVCNGGLTAAALAYATALPEACTAVLGYAMMDVEKGMYTYAPDGGYLESPGYWTYGTDYLHVMMSALDSACGTNYGLYHSPGFADSAYFTAYFETEYGSWGFHDASSGVIDAACLSWFARKSMDPSIQYLRSKSLQAGVVKTNIYDIMWYDPENTADKAEMPLDSMYTQVGAVTMRNTWGTGAVFTGLHGGDNQANHGDLDIGNFILYGRGQKFITELGADDYNIPDYFGTRRWTYYRKRAEGQNTLVIGDVSVSEPDQNKNAVSDFPRVESCENASIAVVDMAPAYESVSEGQRGLYFTENRSTVILQDEISLSSPEMVRWIAHTEGEITIGEGGRTAVIRCGTEKLYCEIVSDDSSLVFSTGAAESFDPAYSVTDGEYSRAGISRLMIVTREPVIAFHCAVAFRVIGSSTNLPEIGSLYTWTPIADWNAEQE
ncbi:MAG: heparinase II/III family protein [Clostridia bacterium]|nr:heparinase II/III family protein [Clostridia bacterium]